MSLVLSKRKKVEEQTETEESTVVSSLVELCERAVSESLTKARGQECSNKSCKRLAHVDARGKGFKQCLPCITSSRESKRRKKEQVCTDNEQVCSVCLKPKPIDQFGFNSRMSNRDVRNKTCFACCNRAKKWRQTNPEILKCKSLWENWKETHACVRCGENDARVIEADHCKGVYTHILSDYTYWGVEGRGTAAMEEEFKVVQALCCYCHRIKSAQERAKAKADAEAEDTYSDKPEAVANRARKATKQREVDKKKLAAGCCIICQREVTEANVSGFDWMHRDRKEKSRYGGKQASVSDLVRNNASLARIEEEIAKCDLGCANCHRKSTIEENAALGLVDGVDDVDNVE